MTVWFPEVRIHRVLMLKHQKNKSAAFVFEPTGIQSFAVAQRFLSRAKSRIESQL